MLLSWVSICMMMNINVGADDELRHSFQYLPTFWSFWSPSVQQDHHMPFLLQISISEKWLQRSVLFEDIQISSEIGFKHQYPNICHNNIFTVLFWTIPSCAWATQYTAFSISMMLLKEEDKLRTSPWPTMVSRLESSCTFDLFGSPPQQNLDLDAKNKWEEVSRVEAMTTKQALSYCFALTTGF